ncbi:MAG: methyltransferase [Sphingomonadaceae bacterium]|nr:methyltransferase [Sphingomonadaceae bacterium]
MQHADTAALIALIQALRAEHYRFTTITPASHARVAARWRGLGHGLADLFGWSRAVDAASIPAAVRTAAEAAGALVHRDGGVASTLRASSLGGALFLHSAWPTTAPDSVFFGPDSYRFARLILSELQRAPPPSRVLDIGAGAGVGGITAVFHARGAELVLTDVNPRALHLAQANSLAAGLSARTVETSGADGIDGAFDLVLLNPPFIADEHERAYRNGGGELGTALPLALSRAGMERLAPRGRLILYSGSPIVHGDDPFHARLAEAARESGCDLSYCELDPDIFGEELERSAYAEVDRIALIAAVLAKA